MKKIYTLLVISLALFSCNNFTADLIIHNAKVYTVNEDFDVVSAVVVKDGKIIDVGAEDLVGKYNAAAVLNLRGLAVYP